MNVDFFKQVADRVKDSMDEHRYVHTLGVAYTSAALAMRYHIDNVDRAMLAGLLHDIGKCIPDEKKIELCTEFEEQITDAEMRNPGLLHAKAGAVIAQEDYWVRDFEILDAIRTHTTGRPNMRMLQKIVYVADFIEPNREDIIPNVDRIQELAFTDLDKCVMVIMEMTLGFLEKKGREIDPVTQAAYDFYKKLIEDRDNK